MDIRKKALLGAGLAVLVAAGGFFLSREKPATPQPQAAASQGYIFDKTYDAPFADIAKAQGAARPGEFNQTADAGAAGYTPDQGGVDPSDYFQENMGISVFTRKYFKHLEKMFKESLDMETHLAQVRDYLFSQLPPEEAEELFALYEKYLNCEMELARQKKEWGEPRDVEGILDMLARIQEFRREYLGKETADALFGADVKPREYAIRRGAIVGDKELYGAEKEDRIRDLTQDMWGDQATDVEAHALPYNLYREKIAIYERDLAEMETQGEKAELVKSFREQFFEPEVVARLEEVDALMEENQEAEDAFAKGRDEIMQDSGLTPEERQQAVDALERQVFGAEAEAHQRREAIEKGRQALMDSRTGEQ